MLNENSWKQKQVTILMVMCKWIAGRAGQDNKRNIALWYDGKKLANINVKQDMAHRRILDRKIHLFK